MTPKGWRKLPLADVATIQTGIAKGARKAQDPVEIPYLRVANVQDGFLDLSEIKTIEVDRSRIERYLLQHGDVLLTEGGDFDKLGRGSVWRGEIGKCVHQNHVFVVRTDPEVLLPEYLSILTGSSYGKSYFRKCSKQSTNLASMNSTQLKAFPVLLPSISEQSAIVESLSHWEQAISVVIRIIHCKTEQYDWLNRKLIYKPKYTHVFIRNVAYEVSERNRKNYANPVLSITNDRGFILPEEQFERKLYSKDLSHYKIVRQGQYAYNPSRINVGSIARLDKFDQGIISPMYVVFETEEIIDSDYFTHWLASSNARRCIQKRAQGSVRETVGFKDFGTIVLPMPKNGMQRKIAGILNLALEEITYYKKYLDLLKKEQISLVQKLLRFGNELEE